jgi:UDP-glucose 4-epimerase
MDHIEHWQNAPLWDVDSIAEATKTWFKYMDKEKPAKPANAA